MLKNVTYQEIANVIKYMVFSFFFFYFSFFFPSFFFFFEFIIYSLVTPTIIYFFLCFQNKQSLKHCHVLKSLSFVKCDVEDEGVMYICHALHDIAVRFLRFSCCSITSKGIESVCSLIRKHTGRRDVLKWEMVGGSFSFLSTLSSSKYWFIVIYSIIFRVCVRRMVIHTQQV